MQHPKTQQHPKTRHLGVLILILAGLGGAGYGIWRAADAEPVTPALKAAVPVDLAQARRKDVPIYLIDIGTVEPFNTVTVRSRVDGELQQVLFREGQDIRQGQLIAVIDPRTFQAALEQAKAKLQQDEAALANAQLNYQRDAKLGKDAFASQQTIDNEQSAVVQLQAQIAQDKAMIDTAQTQLSYTQITAPIDGRAGLRLVDQGNIVHATDTNGLVVLNQIHPITVISTLPQREVAAVRDALAAGPVEAQAVSRDDTTVLDIGTVELIDNQIDPQSGTLRVKSVFPNKGDKLWPGQFVDLRLRVATLPHVVTVPSDAVQRGPNGPFVYTVNGHDTVAATPVEIGQIAEGIAVIQSGLTEGQTVVTRGQYRLAPGTRVTPDSASAGG
ncbi:efflux RND transporter periplasmic adaptor subunit [Ancylobacter sp. VNQ12]|uniref:efflux RND transporter periplasmic adaptor subunit n=1 Tax=Ancylobacter sp. VNQ12 TaxID=3400920 RepID=UPI003C029FED